ncbi:MAG: hypothetical protein QHJ34_09800 [bacterium]|nr:hypothetical protein [candidate division KSB1 bacterium]MDH7560511.1 hypothetical protein [bacterium]
MKPCATARWALWALLVAAALPLGCEERKRLNPLDPLNPVTKGRPTGLSVVSEGHEVILKWDAMAVDRLLGYRVFRQGHAESTMVPVALVSTSQYRDGARPFGVHHAYCVTVVTAEYESPCSEAVTITPGPTYCWVASAYDGAVVRLTHDRRHELLRYGYMAYPWIVEADPVTGNAWVVDAIYGRVSEITTAGNEQVRLGWFRQPSDIGLDYRRRHLWVLEQTATDSAVVHKFTTEGTLIFTRGGLVAPSRMALDVETGTCYIADPGAHKVVRVAANGRVSEVIGGLVWPTGLAWDGRSAQLWIADGSQVLMVSSRSGAVTHAEGPFVKAYVAAANDSTGECWVVDLGAQAGQGQVVRLRKDGSRVASYGPFVQAYGVAVNTYDACCLVADTGGDRLVEINPDGHMEELPVRVARPWDVAVENHYPLR